jgi:hypothetical protein
VTARSELVRLGREIVRWNPPVTKPQNILEISRAYGSDWQGFVDSWMAYQGQIYAPSYTTTIPGSKAEPVIDSFLGYVQGAYRSNGVVFAISLARAMLFTDITFKWRRRGTSGGGNDLFVSADTTLITQPLMMRAEQDTTAAGTFFVVRLDGRLKRLRPDWCEFILTAPPDVALESDVIGIRYTVGGARSGGLSALYPVNPPAGADPEGYATWWAPIPDPEAQYRGMSWLTPVLKEKMSDQAATEHKLKFFENAATPNLAVSLKESVTLDQFNKFVQATNTAHQGVENAYKTMYLGGGADVTVIGANMHEIDFRNTQGAGETRMCAAGRVPPIIVGLSEGLSAATYSNYAQARRAFGDSWARPMWKSFALAMSPLLVLPPGGAADLWYDVADVAFLREDTKDIAEVMSTTMGTINAAVAAGWTPESALAAVLAEDLSQLVHSGLMSVQLQPPGAQNADTGPDPAAEFTTKVTDAVQLIAGGAEPDSAVAAADALDLTLVMFPEPEPDPAADPNAVDPALEAADEANVERRHRAGEVRDYIRAPNGEFAHTGGHRPAAKASNIPNPIAATPAVREAPRPAGVDPDMARLHTEIRGAVSDLADQPGDFVMLSSVRDKLSVKDKPTVDAALKKLGRMDGVSIVPESNQRVLSQADIDAAVIIGAQEKHAIAIEDAR